MTQVDFWILGIICGLVLAYYLLKCYRSYAIKRRLKTAKHAEKRAKQFLEKEGYKVIKIQPRVPVITHVNGKNYKNHIKVDFIVKKNSKTYVVDVKTGKQVERLLDADIRRQLLEYYLVYRTDGALLLDMTNKKLYNLKFDIEMPHNCKVYLAILVAFVFGFVVAFFLFGGGKFF
ncbi:hypothetical protein M1N61_01430 [Peptococcaceae bacterium]|nr:hypothetical protein [Peptococcaceae bacterium]